MELERRLVEREPVVLARDPERLTELPGPEQSARTSSAFLRALIVSTPCVGSASARIRTADAEPLLFADEVDAPVDAVRAVHVRVARG